MLDRLEQLGISPAVAAGIVAGAVIVIGLVILRKLLARKPQPQPPQPDLTIQVSDLADAGPPNSGPTLELLNVPVRIAAVVIATAGRTGATPGDDIAELLDQVVPRLGSVVAAHRPLVRQWPAQVSSHGFANTFFANVRLPGDKGKGTPWCSVTGRFDAAGQKYLVGLLLCSGSANSLSHLVVERETQWLDLLRVRA